MTAPATTGNQRCVCGLPTKCADHPATWAMHDCVQVERDNLDLHNALATAIARIERLNDLNMHGLEYADLFAVLDRTSRPQAKPSWRAEKYQGIQD